MHTLSNLSNPQTEKTQQNHSQTVQSPQEEEILKAERKIKTQIQRIRDKNDNGFFLQEIIQAIKPKPVFKLMKEKGINYKLIFQYEKEITFPDIEKMQQFIASRAALLELLLVEEK